jgi:hypothetical protein
MFNPHCTQDVCLPRKSLAVGNYSLLMLADLRGTLRIWKELALFEDSSFSSSQGSLEAAW